MDNQESAEAEAADEHAGPMDSGSNLKNLDDAFAVLKQLDTPINSRFGFNFLDHDRTLVSQYDGALRLGSLDRKPTECRCYLFSDVLVIAKFADTRKRSTNSNNSGKTVVFGELVGTEVSESPSEESRSQSSTNKQPAATEKLHMKLYFDLKKVRVQHISANNQYGIRFTFARKLENETEIHRSSNGSTVFLDIVAVETMDIWFPDEITHRRLYKDILDVIEQVTEAQLEDDTSMEDDTEDDREFESRSEIGRNGSSAADVYDEIRKTAENLEGELGLESSKKVEFLVEFSPGTLGLAVCSLKGSETGVYVGKVVEGGMAQVAGISVMDKVLEVGGVPIDNTWTHTDCHDLIRDKVQETDESGNRIPLRMKFQRLQPVDEILQTADNVEESTGLIETRRIRRKPLPRNGKHWYLKARDRHQFRNRFGGRVKTLADIKDKYTGVIEMNIERQLFLEDMFGKVIEKLRGRDNVDEQSLKAQVECVRVMEEIHNLERDYVAKLYCLVDQYCDKLKTARTHVRCKDLNLGLTKFCEHKKPAFTCNKQYSRVVRLVTPDDLKMIFSNVRSIIKVSEHLLDSLQKGLETTYYKDEGNVNLVDLLRIYTNTFSETLPYLKLYSVYSSQFPASTAHLHQLMERVDFRETISKLESKSKGRGFSKQAFDMLRHAPVNHVSRYQLLFERLESRVSKWRVSEATDAAANQEGFHNTDHIDDILDHVKDTQRKLFAVTKEVDKYISYHNDLENVSRIYAELGRPKEVENFLTPTRRLLDTFEVMVSDKSKLRTTPRSAVLILFNDMIVFATLRTNTLRKLTKPLARTSSTITLGSVNQDILTLTRRGSMMTTMSIGSHNSLGSRQHNQGTLKLLKAIDIPTIELKALAETTAKGGVGLTILVAPKPAIGKTKAKEGYRIDVFFADAGMRDRVWASISGQIQEQQDSGSDTQVEVAV